MIGGRKSNAIKDLLRSMLHAWYDLTKDEVGAWTTQLEAEVALQQEMNDPVQCCCWVAVVVIECSAQMYVLKYYGKKCVYYISKAAGMGAGTV